MSKAIIKIGYLELAMDLDVAIKFFKVLNESTVYQFTSRYVTDPVTQKHTEVGKVGAYNDKIVMRGVDDADFAMWKLAGESE